ncbi:zinc-binding dehydrogenase [Phenylobacterium sp.]|uniref:zinc-binding dehydrogenase n=1 Tax=Phenylobacterium sp. TaxID=1871053 RepID=UPI002717437C|nr:zinc-binding dehydrogenase [Phenylobacterium sp.]MDO8379714.1 zinc-binding dehydrogenase [Phenylobacterium sp.]
MANETQGLELRSLVKSSGELELSLATVSIPDPGPDEILVRVQASPINPSDLGLLLGPADIAQAKVAGTADRPVVTAPIPPAIMRAMAARADESMPVGNEGAGEVVKAGANAQHLMGKTVAMLGGAMYAQYRLLKAADVLVLPPGASAADGASCFVNPLTALGMVETMRREGHTALVHTAAASNLGQMLNKVCLKDGVELVNIVRSPEQVKILKDIGAKHIVDSSRPDFQEELVKALVATGATLAFDAIGGGKLAGQILNGMEVAANMTAKTYSRYGSTTYKQVYIYGGLNTAPTELSRAFGMSWGLGGWLLTPFLMKIGPEAGAKLRQRVLDELKTTFASHYSHEISLAEALNPEIIAAYNRRATGEKYLINPSKGL